MVDWLFYDEMARDLMREAYKWDADSKNLTEQSIKRFAKDRNLNAKNLKCAYEDVKRKFNPEDDFI